MDSTDLDLKAQEWQRSFGVKFLLQLMDTYLCDAPKRVNDACSALESNDRVRLKRAAHTLKSSSAHIGAMHLAKLAAETERLAGKSDNDADVKLALVALDAEWQQVSVALADLRTKIAADL